MSDTDTGGSDGLSASESAYFESGGTAEIVQEAPVVEKAAEPEAPKEAEGEQPKQPSGKTVPLEALHEERSKRKENEKRARDLELENVRFRERFNVLKEFSTKPEAERVVAPDPETDFVGAIKHQGKTLEQIQQELNQRKQADEESKATSELVKQYSASAAEFARETPDFSAAYTHLLTSRQSELQTLGYSAADIHQQLQQEELSIAQIALQNGKSPAQVIYDLAKQRGYAKKEAADATAKLDNIERGQAANKSLTTAGGAAGDAEMTAEQLVKMPNDEFLAWIDKNPAKARRLGVA